MRIFYPIVGAIFVIFLTFCGPKGKKAVETSLDRSNDIVAHHWCAPHYKYPNLVFRFVFQNDRTVRRHLGFVNRESRAIRFYETHSIFSKWTSADASHPSELTLIVEDFKAHDQYRTLVDSFSVGLGTPTIQLRIKSEDDEIPRLAFPCLESETSKDEVELTLRRAIEIGYRERFIAPTKNILWKLTEEKNSITEIVNREWCRPIVRTSNEIGDFELTVLKLSDNGMDERIARIKVSDDRSRTLTQKVTSLESNVRWTERDGQIVLADKETTTTMAIYRVPFELKFLVKKYDDKTVSDYFYVPCDRYLSLDGTYIFGLYQWKPISKQEPFQITE